MSLVQTITTNAADRRTCEGKKKKKGKKKRPHFSLRTRSFCAGTSNRKLTVLCDTVECSGGRSWPSPRPSSNNAPFCLALSKTVSNVGTPESRLTERSRVTKPRESCFLFFFLFPNGGTAEKKNIHREHTSRRFVTQTCGNFSKESYHVTGVS